MKSMQVIVMLMFMKGLVNNLASAASPQKTRLTLHTKAENWNDASIVCRRRDGYLVPPRTDRQRNILTKLFTFPPWADHVVNTTLVGLAWVPHKEGFTWRGCESDVTTIRAEDGMCGALAVTTGQLVAVSCFAQPMTFICQHQTSGMDPCSIEQYPEQVPVNNRDVSRTHVVGASTVRQCNRACNMAGYRCLAFSFSAATRRCMVYDPEDLFHFYKGRNIASDTSTNTFIKVCYEVDAYSGPHLVRHSASLTPFRWYCQGNRTVHLADKEKIIYIFHEHPATWDEAKATCESMKHTLAEFDSLEKRKIVPQLMLDQSSQLYWSGFQDDGSDELTWIESGLEVKPEPGDETVDSGSRSCGASLLPGMSHKLLPCTKQLPFVCERKRAAEECGFQVLPHTRLGGTSTAASLVNPELIALDLLRNEENPGCFSCSTTDGQGCVILDGQTWQDCYDRDNNILQSSSSADVEWTSYRFTCFGVVEWDSEETDTTTANIALETSETTDHDITTSSLTFGNTMVEVVTSSLEGMITDNAFSINDEITEVVTEPIDKNENFTTVTSLSSRNEWTSSKIITESSEKIEMTQTVTKESTSYQSTVFAVTTAGMQNEKAGSDTTSAEASEKSTTVTSTKDAVQFATSTATDMEIQTATNSTSERIETVSIDDIDTTDPITLMPNTRSEQNDEITFSSVMGNKYDTTAQTTSPAVDVDHSEISHGSSPASTNHFQTGREPEETSPQGASERTQPSPSAASILNDDFNDIVSFSEHTTSVQESTVPTFISTVSVRYRTTIAGLPLCSCSCSNATLSIGFSRNKIRRLLEELEEYSHGTGSAARRKESAPDSRPSSVAIGCMATVLLASIFFIVLVSDGRHLYKWTRQYLINLTAKMKL